MNTIRGAGKYVVEVLAYDQKAGRPSRFVPPFIEGKYTLRIVESDNPAHPVGSMEIVNVRLREDGTPFPAFADACAKLQVGTTLSLETQSTYTKNGQPFTRYYWGAPSVFGRAFGSVPNVQSMPRPAVAYGATCKRCNEHNPHAEARADFVCYGCRH